MTISKQSITCKLDIYNKVIEQTMEFNYLGTYITSDEQLNKEAGTQVGSTSVRMSKNLIWQNTHTSADSKTIINKTVLRPILTFLIDTRRYTKDYIDDEKGGNDI